MDSRINVQLIGGGETCHACHAHGNHPARRAPGARRRDRHRHGTRRRARTRGLLPLPAVLGDRAGGEPQLRGRLVPHVLRRTARPGGGRRLRRPHRRTAPTARGGTGGAACDRPRRCGLRASRRPPYRPLAARRLGRIPPGLRHRRRPSPRGRARRVRRGSHPADVAVPPRPGTGAGRAARRPPVRRQLPLHAHGRGTGRRTDGGRRALPRLHRRPRLQRLHLHRPGDRVHRCRRRRLPRRSRRRALRSAARRSAQPRSGHPGRHRHPGPHRRLDPRTRPRGGADHGLRAPRLPHRGSALTHAPLGRPELRRPAMWGPRPPAPCPRSERPRGRPR